jgi:cytochrome c-type biogenesis protein CcmH
MVKWTVGLCLAIMAMLSWGKEATPVAEDPALEARVVKISAELRCLVCQNQTIADSSAGLAIDLRNQVREMLRNGQSNREILDYMTARYGDFVLYRPPVKATTVILWFGPAILLLGGAVMLIVVLRRRSKMPPELFESDETEATDRPPAG